MLSVQHIVILQLRSLRIDQSVPFLPPSPQTTTPDQVADSLHHFGTPGGVLTPFATPPFSSPMPSTVSQQNVPVYNPPPVQPHLHQQKGLHYLELAPNIGPFNMSPFLCPLLPGRPEFLSSFIQHIIPHPHHHLMWVNYSQLCISTPVSGTELLPASAFLIIAL